ncbi:MAG: SCP2 sterol-binding domain-containing protein [Candidatus Dormibacteraeota bacterium]|nr:SCP2 sterol-binding domain-containing protein [Candidatus Dormibacteraeota bacterium]MBV9526689.1 SCP2 sterol-binding domain-containing protein [Candidatus Dormibacteraeota bacterium]
MAEAVVYEAYSPEWAQAFKDEINKSSVYKQAAAGWEGSVGLVVLAEPDKNVPEDLGIFLDLWHGEARDVKIVSRPDAEKADYVITGSYSRWKKVATKQLDATKGIMLGQLKLRGNFPTIVRYTKASQELTECTTRVAVRWPDDN